MDLSDDATMRSSDVCAALGINTWQLAYMLKRGVVKPVKEYGPRTRIWRVGDVREALKTYGMKAK